MRGCGGGTCAWREWRGQSCRYYIGAVFCVLRIRGVLCDAMRDGIAGGRGKYLSGD